MSIISQKQNSFPAATTSISNKEELDNFLDGQKDIEESKFPAVTLNIHKYNSDPVYSDSANNCILPKI